MTDVQALYRRATREVFKLETRQQYAVPDEDAQYKAFREGQPIPKDPAVEKSMDIIRTLTARGVLVHRVHVIDLPLTEYLRYELAAYEENLAVGEHVYIAVRTPRLAVALDQDLVLFDPATPRQAVVHMHYDTEGHVTERYFTEDPGFVAAAVMQRDAALAGAVPLREFTVLAEAG